MYYIQEADKPNVMLKKLNIIQMIGDKIILPIDDKEITSKKARKLAQKIEKIMNKAISKKVVISKKIYAQEELVNILHTLNLDIVEGRWLFEVIACRVLTYILEKKQMKKEETSIAILVNDLSEYMVCNIRKMAKEYRRVSIITNHIEKFKKIEKQILDEDGIMITIGNNKKKGIAKSSIILNVDFPSELVNQYNIYENAILVNIRGNVKITKKRFNGITINDYDISFQKGDEFDYDKKTKYKSYQIYESQINKKQTYEDIMKQIEKDKLKIEKLIGINSSI